MVAAHTRSHACCLAAQVNRNDANAMVHNINTHGTTYFGAIVKSLVNDIIMPPVGKLIGGIDFASFKYVIQPAVEAEGTVEIAIRYGVFINTIITFLIVAFAIFLVVRFYNKLKDKFEAEKEVASAAPPAPSKEEVLLTEIRDLLKKK